MNEPVPKEMLINNSFILAYITIKFCVCVLEGFLLFKYNC